MQEYEKNKLEYYLRSYYEILLDCNYKEKKANNTFTCIVRISELNEELFEKIRNFR